MKQYIMIFLVYLLIINLIAFICFGVDKRKAIKQQWRIPESRLMMTAVLGGSIGAMIGMQVFRHKTKHMKFTVGIPLILAIELIVAFMIFSRFI